MSRRSVAGSRRIAADCYINNLFPREMPATCIDVQVLHRGMAYECVVDGAHRISSGVYHGPGEFFVCRVSRLSAFYVAEGTFEVQTAQGAWIESPVAHLEGGDSVRGRCTLRQFRSDEAFSRWLSVEVPSVVRDYFSHSQGAPTDNQNSAEGHETGHTASLTCSKCGKVYTRAGWFVNHEAKCTVNVQGTDAPTTEAFGPLELRQGRPCTSLQFSDRRHIPSVFGGNQEPLPSGEGSHCPRCGKMFQNIGCVQAHIDACQGRAPAAPRRRRPKTFHCRRCGKSYTSKNFLRRHEEAVHVSLAISPLRVDSTNDLDHRCQIHGPSPADFDELLNRGAEDDDSLQPPLTTNSVLSANGEGGDVVAGGPTTIEVATGQEELSQCELEDFASRHFVAPGVRFEIQYTMTSDPAAYVWFQNGTFSHFQQELDGSRVAVVTYPSARGHRKVRELLMVSDDVRIVSLKLMS